MAQEHYTHGYDDILIGHLRQRNVKRNAGFLLPHLRAGMSLLDCGCGPGAITIGLAEIVSPGQVVGVDISPDQIELARDNAAGQGVSNLRFEIASVYALPFMDASFDAVLAHTLLQHLQAPVTALQELHRIMKPGGVIGVREEDCGGVVFSPSTATLEQSFALFERVWRHDGGDPRFARRHREVLHQAGFVRVEASATCSSYGEATATREFGDIMASLIRTATEQATQLGWADTEATEKAVAAWKQWGRHPDAFYAEMFCEAIGWKT